MKAFYGVRGREHRIQRYPKLFVDGLAFLYRYSNMFFSSNELSAGLQ
jgi:hypothetical protein